MKVRRQLIPITWTDVHWARLNINYIGVQTTPSYSPRNVQLRRRRQLHTGFVAGVTPAKTHTGIAIDVWTDHPVLKELQTAFDPKSIFEGFQMHLKTPSKDHNMSKPDKSDTPQNSAMKTLIIYQDFASAAKANIALQDAARYPDVRVEWNIRPWRLDMLKFPPTAAEALVDATDAHLIVFAGDCARSFPYWLQDWLEQWAGCRQIEAAALAVFGIGKGGELSRSAAPDLSQFAKRHGLSVIFDDRPAVKHVSPFPPEFLLDPMASESLILPQTLDRQISAAYRGWGINE